MTSGKAKTHSQKCEPTKKQSCNMKSRGVHEKLPKERWKKRRQKKPGKRIEGYFGDQRRNLIGKQKRRGECRKRKDASEYGLRTRNVPHRSKLGVMEKGLGKSRQRHLRKALKQ